MADIVRYEQVKDRIIVLRGEPVLLDADVAQLYGVETKRVNEAVKNNPYKFPEGFLIQLTLSEKQEVVENFDHLQNLKYSPVNPTAFTERGLYMLATILKSPRATQTTIAIINTFVQSERDIEEGRYYTTEEVFHPHYHSLDEFADKLAKKLGEHYGLTDIREML